MLLLILISLLIVVVGATSAFTFLQKNSKTTILTDTLSVPSDGITAAAVEINPGDGNLRIDPLAGSEPLLASGDVQYSQKLGAPARSLSTNNGQASFSLKANPGAQRWSALPWAACNSATEWKISLKPGIVLDLNAHSNGGNIALNLAGLTATRVQANTGGGNINLILPDPAESLTVTVKTGAGNVTVEIPAGTAARIYASTGLGKVIMDARYSKIDDKTYQSPDYATAAKKVELNLQSGAGNVSVSAK